MKTQLDTWLNTANKQQMDKGFIKLHRSLLDWEWYDDIVVFKVFLHLILTANYKDKKYKGMTLKAGTVVTGREKLANSIGVSVRQVRTALDKLEATNELTSLKSSKGTIITIVNYKKYQLATSETTNERPTSDQQTTTNKKGKKEKNKEKINKKEFECYPKIDENGYIIPE